MVIIDVDFEAYKALTSLRETESVTYNDVVRRLLKLTGRATQPTTAPQKGATFKGVFFPEGTQFRATYKGRTYTAEIKDGVWKDRDGTMRNSPSEAAVKITGKNWNGWRFWYCQRPGETSWTLMDARRNEPSFSDQ
jgi:hypothetical protein